MRRQMSKQSARSMVKQTHETVSEKSEKIVEQRKRQWTVEAVYVAIFLFFFGIVPYVLWSDPATTESAVSATTPGLRNPNAIIQQRILNEKVEVVKGKETNDHGHEIKDAEEDEAYLEGLVQRLDARVRALKANPEKNFYMEVDPEGMEAAKKLQDASRRLIRARYSPEGGPIRVRVFLDFPPSMVNDFSVDGKAGSEADSFVIEMAPLELQPVSVLNFLEVCRRVKRAAFHRVAGHVLQAFIRTTDKREFRHQAMPLQALPFQEYSPEYPHRKGTVGYAGRPSGPTEWYVSIQDNTRNHGPGSQQKRNPHEADSCFGTIVEGFEDVVIKRLRNMDGNGFIRDAEKMVTITSMVIFVPSSTGDGSFVPWEQTK